MTLWDVNGIPDLCPFQQCPRRHLHMALSEVGSLSLAECCPFKMVPTPVVPPLKPTSFQMEGHRFCSFNYLVLLGVCAKPLPHITHYTSVLFYTDAFEYSQIYTSWKFVSCRIITPLPNHHCWPQGMRFPCKRFSISQGSRLALHSHSHARTQVSQPDFLNTGEYHFCLGRKTFEEIL